MKDAANILELIKKSVSTTDPGAIIILYGSYARGDFREDSDIDILVLIEKDKVTMDDRMRISSSLNHISLETGMLISPFVTSKKEWTNHKVTPFFENVKNEGIAL